MQNPCVSLIDDEFDQREVISTKASGFLPDIAIAKQSGNGDRVAYAGASISAPDTDFDTAKANDVNGWACHISNWYQQGEKDG